MRTDKAILRATEIIDAAKEKYPNDPDSIQLTAIVAAILTSGSFVACAMVD